MTILNLNYIAHFKPSIIFSNITLFCKNAAKRRNVVDVARCTDVIFEKQL